MSFVGGSAPTRGKATAIGSTSDFRPLHGFHLLHSRLAKIGLSATGKAVGPSRCQACGTGRVIDQKAIGLISSIAGIDPSGRCRTCLPMQALAQKTAAKMVCASRCAANFATNIPDVRQLAGTPRSACFAKTRAARLPQCFPYNVFK